MYERNIQVKNKSTISDSLNFEEDSQLVHLLTKCTGKTYSQKVFIELTRLTPQTVIEVVILRMHNNVIETLLIPRPADDIIWSGMSHTPGSPLRNVDFEVSATNPASHAFKRIEKEVKVPFVKTPILAEMLFRQGDRGNEAVIVYITELSSQCTIPNTSYWVPIDKLDKDKKFIQSQLDHVKLAANFYRKTLRIPE